MSGGTSCVEGGVHAALQGLVMSVEAERLAGGLRVRHRAAGDQVEEGIEGRVVSRRGEGQNDGVANVGPILLRQPHSERADGLGPSGLAKGHGGGSGNVTVLRTQAL